MGREPLSAAESISLVERLSGGDQTAEEELVNAFEQRVFVMTLSRTRDRETARELCQDVMMSLLKALRGGQLKNAESLPAFVYGIARNLVNNHFRARTRDPHL